MFHKHFKHAIEDARIHFPVEAVRLELYRLAGCFYSSRPLRDLSDGGDHCPYQTLRDDFERSEIARILIVLGSSGRLICDDLKRLGYAAVYEKNLVGTIHDDVSKDKVRQLNVLEACSKILHAKLIVPSVWHRGQPYRQYLRPRISLYSDHSKTIGWAATLSVEDLIAGFGNITG